MPVVSEVGLRIGEGKRPTDFLYDPGRSNDDALLRVARVAFCCSLRVMVASLARIAATWLRYHKNICPVNQKCHL